MPSEWSAQNTKKVDRNFFFGILTSLAGEYVEQLVLDLRKQRIEQQASRNARPQNIGVAPQWVDSLLSQPYIPVGKYFEHLMLIFLLF